MLQSILPLIEKAINVPLALDKTAMGHLQQYQGEIIEVYIKDWQQRLYLVVEKEGFGVRQQPGKPSVCVTGTVFSLLKMGMAKNTKETLVAKKGVTITGNIALGQAMGRLLKALHIDWEEHLSSVVGDMAAHTLGRCINGAFEWGRQTKEAVIKNTSEYLHEELRATPTKETIEDFNNAVDGLKCDGERLMARWQQLREAHL